MRQHIYSVLAHADSMGFSFSLLLETSPYLKTSKTLLMDNASQNPSKDFHADLKRAHDLENQLKKTLEDNWNCKVETTQLNGSDSRYDLIVQFLDGSNDDITIEVKEDKQSKSTGNIAIELGRTVNNHWRNTGINATKADVWAIYFDDAFHFIATKQLKNMVIGQQYLFKAYGGDCGRAYCAIFSKETILKKTITLNKV